MKKEPEIGNGEVSWRREAGTQEHLWVGSWRGLNTPAQDPPTLQWTWGGLGPDALLTQQGQRELDDGQRNRESGQTYQ